MLKVSWALDILIPDPCLKTPKFQTLVIWVSSGYSLMKIIRMFVLVARFALKVQILQQILH